MGSVETSALTEEETNYSESIVDSAEQKVEFDDIFENQLTEKNERIILEYPLYQFFIRSMTYILSNYENKDGSYRCEVQLDAKIKNSRKEWMNFIKEHEKLIEIKDAKSRIRQAFSVKSISDLKYYYRIGKIYGYLIMFQYLVDDCIEDFNYIYELMEYVIIKEDDKIVEDYILLGIISVLLFAKIPNVLDPLHDEKAHKIIYYLLDSLNRNIDNLEMATEIIDLVMQTVNLFYEQFNDHNLCNYCINSILQYFIHETNLNKPFYISSKLFKS